MKKTRIIFMLLALIFVTSLTVFAAEKAVTVKIDAKMVEFDVQPTIHNGRTMVPLRKIFEALGATVKWDDATRTVTSTKGSTTIKVKIDSKTMTVNGKSVALDVPAMIIGGRTLVPVRAISESFGCQVGWDGNSRMVSIVNDKNNFAMVYAPGDRSKVVAKKDVASNLKVGWYDEPLVYVYAPGDQSKLIEKSRLNDYLAVGWYAEPVQRLYAPGKSAVFKKSEVASQLKVGWYTEPVVLLYAPGKSKYFKQSEVESQLKVGWYKEPVVLLYAPGKSKYFEESKVNAQLNSGWYRDAALTDNEVIYATGEVWKVNGQWELSFEDAIQTVIKNGKQTVQITWKYKNIGYDGKLDIGRYEFDVYDEEMEVADDTLFDVDYKNYSGADCPQGVKATCVYGWILNNDSDKIKICVEVKDSYGEYHSAWFELNVIPKPEEPEEDKLEGCTFKVDNSLPKTISYYKYDYDLEKTVKQCSCSVTDISFEVSGDDLYIYFTGKKTYDYRGSGQSASCYIGWKLYDSNNNVIASSSTSTLGIAEGEGFVKAKGYAWDCITPGASYRLVIMDVN